MQEDKRISEAMTLTEAAAFIRVSEKTLGEMARARRIPSQKVGREWRFLRSALEAWLAGELPSPARGQTDIVSDRLSFVVEPAIQYELPFAGFRDTAFTENHDRTLHRWVPWIAGFSGSFVAGVLEQAERTRHRLRVLDPFAGVGTTLVEALKHGNDAIGFEINPYAALACKAKVNAAQYDVGLLEVMLDRFEEYGEEKLCSPDGKIASVPPAGFVSRVPFFSPDVERQVLVCLDFVAEETTDWLRELFQVALGAVMVGVSNYSYEPSLGTRVAAGKPAIDHADVIGIVTRKLREMWEDICTFQSWMATRRRVPRARVYPESYFDGANKIEPHSIDVLITSPPYLNNYHYIRNTRPHMFWLGMVSSPADLKTMERESFGQFWQTVRSGPEVELQTDLPELAELLAKLRTQNGAKGAYGGPGWANYAAAYFNDCQRFCQVTRQLMRPGGTVVVVIGNNILQGIEFQTDRLFADIARQQGFEIVDLHEVRQKRTGTSIVNSSVRAGTVKQRTRLYETAIEMRAPHSTCLSSR
jgi:excisionase family DNA binding protein